MPATFKVEGVVSRKPYTSEKFAFLPLAVPGQSRTYIDIKAFDRALIAVIAGLKPGDAVTVEGTVISETIRVDKREVVDARGKPVWGIALRASSIGDVKAAPPPAASDDGADIPFA